MSRRKKRGGKSTIWSRGIAMEKRRNKKHGKLMLTLPANSSLGLKHPLKIRVDYVHSH